MQRLPIVSGPLLWVVFVLSSCGSEVETRRPLFDSDHRADVLVEESLLSRPRSVEQNRLLRGWRFVRQGDQPRLEPNGSESVIEFVNIGDRPKLLVIDVADHATEGPSHVGVRLNRRDLGRYPMSDRIEIKLPDSLPIGRVTLALEFSKPESLSIERISISPTVSAGGAEIQKDRIEQHGWSIVEISRWADIGDRLVVAFQPPESATADQRFAVTVENSLGGLRKPFAWKPSTGTDAPSSQEVDIPLVNEAGPVRIRFLARGEGPAGRWLNPQIAGPTPPAETDPAPRVDDPPRLVVLYVMDALRADHLGHLGPSDGLTPTLDLLAANGASFANHFAVAPNTPPSTRALFSGLCMLDDRQLPHPGPARLAELFRGAGYRTASITGNPHLSPSLDLGAGFETVDLRRVTEDHHPNHPPTVNTSAELLHTAALEWLDRLGPDDRAFLYLHTMNPHNPYTPPAEIKEGIVDQGPSTIDGRTRTLVAIRDRQREVDPDDRRRMRQLYAAGVAYNDTELGRFLDGLGRRFEPRETLFIATSDHGEELFEHGGVLHGFTLYDEMLQIPLIVHWPGRVTPQMIENLSNTLDLHASLRRVVSGLDENTTRRSFWPALLHPGSEGSTRRLTFAAAPGLDGAVMARSRKWKLIRAPRNGFKRGQGHGRGRSWDLEYVFDLEADPSERHNIAGTPDLEIAWMRTRLSAWVETQRRLQPSPGDQQMDSETREQLEALGYLIED